MARLNFVERLVVNNSLWTALERRYVLPVWLSSFALGGEAVALEIGCGRGASTSSILSAYPVSRIDAMDIDYGMITKGRRHYGGDGRGVIRFYVGDAHEVPAKDSSYDAVFDLFTLHHLEEWEKAVAESARALKPGGYFAFAEVYGSLTGSYPLRQLFAHPSESRFERDDLVRALSDNRLRLMEGKNTLHGHGLIGVARKIQ